MTWYYVGLESRSHAFLLERRMKNEGIACEITYMPRDIMIDLCNMGVKFEEAELEKALGVLRRSGLPGCRLYVEYVQPDKFEYLEVFY